LIHWQKYHSFHTSEVGINFETNNQSQPACATDFDDWNSAANPKNLDEDVGWLWPEEFFAM
jgi:hypothetical protein